MTKAEQWFFRMRVEEVHMFVSFLWNFYYMNIYHFVLLVYIVYYVLAFPQ